LSDSTFLAADHRQPRRSARQDHADVALNREPACPPPRDDILPEDRAELMTDFDLTESEARLVRGLNLN
jgi:hypothetical protein